MRLWQSVNTIYIFTKLYLTSEQTSICNFLVESDNGPKTRTGRSISSRELQQKTRESDTSGCRSNFYTGKVRFPKGLILGWVAWG